MKYFISAVILGLGVSAHAATGQLVYEAAASSATHATVTLSSTTPTLISKAPTTTVPAGQVPIQWYSVTLFNVAASTGAYAFSASATVAPTPALTCANGIPIGAAVSGLYPWSLTEQFFGMYMWGISCATDATLALKVVYRGR